MEKVKNLPKIHGGKIKLKFFINGEIIWSFEGKIIWPLNNSLWIMGSSCHEFMKFIVKAIYNYNTQKKVPKHFVFTIFSNDRLCF